MAITRNEYLPAIYTGSWSVYVHTNKINNKKYFGITKRAENRWGYKGKNYKRNPHFWASINKYGWDNFSHIFLHQNLTRDEACVLEIIYISAFNTTNQKNGYNKTGGGEGFLGVRHFGKDNPFYGKRHTEETRQKNA